mmetsp:Transcript_21324/g.19402  ORF Transcript_21324/g.19402 Transcript_21324/m.19402 type:complete len:220 (-) Transcript_21324:52-711(-)
MHRLFGKPKVKEPPPSLNDATGSINTRIAEIDVKIKGLEDELRKFQAQLKTAKGSAATMLKKRAIDTLKRKKMYETQRDQLAGQQFNIDQTSFAIETIKSTHITVAAMKEANKTLKVETKKLNISEIEDMQDDLEDQLEDAGEISDILGRSYGTPNDIDEADLEAELACLGDELESIDVEQETPAYLQPSVALPQQPTSSILSNNNPNKQQLDEYGLPV